MKKTIFAIALSLVALLSARAQFGNFGDVPVEIDAEDVSGSNGLAIAHDNVVIHYGDSTIYCDYAEYNPDTRDVLVRGNVRIYRAGQVFTAERAIYNFETKQVRAADFEGSFHPMMLAGDTLSTLGPDAYIVKNGVFTTSDSSKPDYHLRARQVRIYSKDRIVFSRVTLFVGETPIFWWPYLAQSLKQDQAFTFTPGYLSSWGAFLLTQYTFPIANNSDILGTFHFDLRSERGLAVGFDTKATFGKDKDDQSYINFHSYYANDASPETDQTGQGRTNTITDRYRVTVKSRLYLTDDIYATVDVNKLSDSRYLEDFEKSDFRLDPEPDNVIALTKRADNFTIDLITRKQPNDFYDMTERLPELDFDTTTMNIFKSPFFYQGSASIGRLKRNFGDETTLPDYQTTRFDTYHQISFPNTYFGWLSVIPHAGVRGTDYSNSGQFADETNVITLDSLVPGEAPKTETQTTTVLETGGSIFRPAFDVGLQASFKLSKTWDLAQSRPWGIDGIRHVIQPYTEISYVNSGKNPDDILQYDRYNPSTQPFELSFPEFNSIDAISTWSIWRVGVYNRLQTRRDNQTINWLELNTFFDVNLDKPDFPNGVFNEGSLSNLYNTLRWNLLPWVNLNVDSQIPLDNQGFSEVNTALSFMVTQDLRLNLSHRYIWDNSFFQDSSLASVGAYYRVNDNWGLSVREDYEFADNVLQRQRYEIYRDLSSWVASLGFVIQDNGIKKEYGFLLTFTLKDLPQVSLPLSIDPGQSF